MAKHQPFVIPAGVSLQLTDRGISIEHVGDIILQSSLGDTMNRIVSQEGSVTLRGKFDLDHVAAPQGTVRLEGTVKARSVQGEVVEIVGARFRAAAVQGSKQIVLGATKIDVDVLVAPRIDIDAKASGRVPIIESRNEPGPNAIKGGFSIAEYDELIGNVASYLAERGVEPLEPGEEEEASEDDDDEPSDVVIEAYAAEESELETLDEEDDSGPTGIDDEAVEDPDTYTDAVALKVGVATAAPDEPVVVEPGVDPYDESYGDPEPVEVEDEPSLPDLEAQDLAPMDGDSLPLPRGARSVPADEPVETAMDEEQVAEAIAQVDETFQDLGNDEADTAHGQLLEILQELESCYEDGEQPPVLGELAELVAARQYDEIVARLPQIWNDLVKYHRERGLRIRRQVTTTFNNIMTIVKNAPSVNLGQQ